MDQKSPGNSLGNTYKNVEVQLREESKLSLADIKD
jgi:hypothetical protein